MNKNSTYKLILYITCFYGLIYLVGLATRQLVLHPHYLNLIVAFVAALIPLFQNRIHRKIILYICLFSVMAMVIFSTASIQSSNWQAILPFCYQLSALIMVPYIYFYDLAERKNPVNKIKPLIKNIIRILSAGALSLLFVFFIIKSVPPAFTDTELQSHIVGPGDSISSNNYGTVFYIKPHSAVPSKTIYWKGSENLNNSWDNWIVSPFNFLEADTIQAGDFFEYDYVSKPTRSVGELTRLYFADHFNKKSVPISGPPLDGKIFVKGKERHVFKNVQAYFYNDPNDTFPYIDTSRLIPRPNAYFLPVEQALLLNGQFNFSAPTDELTNLKTRQWGERLRNSGMTDVEIVNTVLRYFLNEDFKYTRKITTPVKNINGIDSFLFENQTGYCQHYSSSLALLLNSAGVPTKVVTGFAGLEPSKEPGMFKVSGNKAHAWNEVWLQGYGWVGVDPTAYGRNIEPPPGWLDHIMKWIQESSESLTGSSSLATPENQSLLSQIQDKIAANLTTIYSILLLLMYLSFVTLMFVPLFKKKKTLLYRKLMLEIISEMIDKKIISPANKNFWKDAANELTQKNHPLAQEFEMLVNKAYKTLYEAQPLNRELSSQLKHFLKKVNKIKEG